MGGQILLSKDLLDGPDVGDRLGVNLQETAVPVIFLRCHQTLIQDVDWKSKLTFGHMRTHLVEETHSLAIRRDEVLGNLPMIIARELMDLNTEAWLSMVGAPLDEHCRQLHGAGVGLTQWGALDLLGQVDLWVALVAASHRWTPECSSARAYRVDVIMFFHPKARHCFHRVLEVAVFLDSLETGHSSAEMLCSSSSRRIWMI